MLVQSICASLNLVCLHGQNGAVLTTTKQCLWIRLPQWAQSQPPLIHSHLQTMLIVYCFFFRFSLFPLLMSPPAMTDKFLHLVLTFLDSPEFDCSSRDFASTPSFKFFLFIWGVLTAILTRSTSPRLSWARPRVCQPSHQRGRNFTAISAAFTAGNTSCKMVSTCGETRHGYRLFKNYLHKRTTKVWFLISTQSFFLLPTSLMCFENVSLKPLRGDFLLFYII